MTLASCRLPGPCRQLDLGCLPTVMNQFSRLGGPFADPLVTHRRGISPDVDRSPSDGNDQRLQLEQTIQHTAALLQAGSGCRADLSIRILAQILLDQIDQPGLALQRGQQCDGRIA